MPVILVGALGGMATGGIIGMFVGATMLNLTPGNYMRETISTLTLTNLFGGLLKATTYGVLIALAGCLRGFQCGNSSSAVGDAAVCWTKSVITVFAGTDLPSAGNWFQTVPTGMFSPTGPSAMVVLGVAVNPSLLSSWRAVDSGTPVSVGTEIPPPE